MREIIAQKSCRMRERVVDTFESMIYHRTFEKSSCMSLELFKMAGEILWYHFKKIKGEISEILIVPLF